MNRRTDALNKFLSVEEENQQHKKKQVSDSKNLGFYLYFSLNSNPKWNKRLTTRKILFCFYFLSPTTKKISPFSTVIWFHLRLLPEKKEKSRKKKWNQIQREREITIVNKMCHKLSHTHIQQKKMTINCVITVFLLLLMMIAL